jgi:PKD repeat protein
MKNYLLVLVAVLFIAGCSHDEETQIPVACFTYSSHEAKVFVHDTVWFTNCSQNATSYSWDFGDSTTETVNNPFHIYDKSKQYEVVLTAYGSGTNSDTATTHITVWIKVDK